MNGMKVSRLCVGLIIFMMGGVVFGQKRYHPNISDPMLEMWRHAYFPELEDKGLRSIASESASGQYWFALDSGVMSYDGYNWKLFDQNDGLTGLPVQRVFVDNNDKVHAATSSGLFRFDGKSQWKNLLKTDENVSFNFHIIKQLESGTIACGTSEGLLLINAGKNTLLTTEQIRNELEDHLRDFTFVDIPESLLYQNTFDHFSDIFEVAIGQLWLAVTYMQEDEIGDIIIVSESEVLDNNLESYNLLSKYYDIYLGYEQTIFKTRSGNIWIINQSNKLPALKYENGRWYKVPYGKQFGDDEYSESILELEDGTIWIGGIGNLYCLSPQGKWTKYSSESLNIPQAHIELHLGNNSDLWIYGYQSNIYKVDLSREKWLTYEDINYQCEKKNGEKWYLDFEGRAIYEKDNTWFSLTQKSGLIDNPVSLFADSRDVVWAIGSHKGVAGAGYWSRGKWTNFNFDSLSWGIDYRAIMEDNDGNIWLGGCTDVFLDEGQTGGVIQIIDPYSDRRQIIHHKARTNGLNQLNSYGLAQDQAGNIWMGGSRLTYFDGQKWNNLDHSDFNDFVNEIHGNHQNEILVGSRKHGLFIQSDDQWINYSVQNGLNSNNIISIATNQHNDEIWLATDKDFSFFNGTVWSNNIFPEQLTFSYEGGSIFINEQDEIWISRSLREWKRRVYTGKNPDDEIKKKFTTYRFVKDDTPPETSIDVFAETVDRSGNTTIFWSGRHFFNKVSADKLFYSYRLNDGEWSEFSRSQNHTFTGLDDGKYTFQVQAMDTEGNIDPTPAQASFLVTPPVWKQTWFILLILAFVTVVGYFQYLIIKKREILSKLNKSLQSANEELAARNEEVQTQKDSLEVAVKKIDELSKAKVKFFTNITHEFRTPLSLILGPIDKLSHDQNHDPSVQNFYTLIKKNTLRLQKLINQLLEVRRIESGNLALQLETTDVVGFARDVKNLFNNQAIDRNITFNFHSDFDKLTILLDQDKIEKILFNLLSNAFKHTPKNGSINVELLQAEKYLMKDSDLDFVRLIVRDTGNGMDEKILEHLFERFAVGDNDILDQQSENSGIGLSYIKDLIEAHKGNIKVESEPNVGTAFTVYIPENLSGETENSHILDEEHHYDFHKSVDASILETQVHKVDPSVDSENKDKPSILIAEDNEDMRYFISNILSSEYNVLLADDGQQGLDMLDREYVDLILSDIMMTHVDGITFCQRIKTNPTVSHIPVILLTALNVEDKRIDGYKSGADSYIVKPFKPRLLLARVKNLLESRESLKHKYAEDLRFKPKDIKVTSADEEFMDKLSSLMEEYVSDSQFDVSRMCEMTHMSHMHFIRKVKQLTGKKPIELLKSFRLSRAKQLLEQNKINVSEVGYMVGYDLPNSFTRAFKNEFGVSPTQFAAQSKVEVGLN